MSEPKTAEVKSGDLHTLMMDLIREDIQRQHPEAFTEDNDFDLIIQSGPERPSYVKIDTSSLAEAILPHVQHVGGTEAGGTASESPWMEFMGCCNQHPEDGHSPDCRHRERPASPPAETGEGEADHIGDATTMIATHPDDLAVDRFAAAMKVKLAKKRADGRGGWEDKSECSAEFLSGLLRGHVEKGDPLDVGNLAMMLHQRGEGITPAPASPPAETGEVCDTALREHFKAMQRMATAYLVPEDYRDRDGKVTFHGDHNNTEQWKQGQRGFRAQAFAGDMIYMLDGPEERASLSTHPASDTERMRAALRNIADCRETVAFGHNALDFCIDQARSVLEAGK